MKRTRKSGSSAAKKRSGGSISIRAIESRLRQGATLKDVAKAFGLSRQRVLQLAQDAGVDTRSGMKVRAARRWRKGLTAGTRTVLVLLESRGVDAKPIELRVTSRHLFSRRQLRAGRLVLCIHETAEHPTEHKGVRYFRPQPCRHAAANYAVYVLPDDRIFITPQGHYRTQFSVRVDRDGAHALWRDAWPPSLMGREN